MLDFLYVYKSKERKNDLKKKNQVGKLLILDLKTYFKANIIKSAGYEQ